MAKKANKKQAAAKKTEKVASKKTPSTAAVKKVTTKAAKASKAVSLKSPKGKTTAVSGAKSDSVKAKVSSKKNEGQGSSVSADSKLVKKLTDVKKVKLNKVDSETPEATVPSMQKATKKPIVEAPVAVPLPVESKPPKKAKAPKKGALSKKAKEKQDLDANAKWGDLHEKYKDAKAISYSMKDSYEANQPIMHKVLGWGWIVSSENDRLEVLFKDGRKILISNYKS